jgi:hypothetical protein
MIVGFAVGVDKDVQKGSGPGTELRSGGVFVVDVVVQHHSEGRYAVDAVVVFGVSSGERVDKSGSIDATRAA